MADKEGNYFLEIEGVSILVGEDKIYLVCILLYFSRFNLESKMIFAINKKPLRGEGTIQQNISQYRSRQTQCRRLRGRHERPRDTSNLTELIFKEETYTSYRLHMRAPCLQADKD